MAAYAVIIRNTSLLSSIIQYYDCIYSHNTEYLIIIQYYGCICSHNKEYLIIIQYYSVLWQHIQP